MTPVELEIKLDNLAHLAMSYYNNLYDDITQLIIDKYPESFGAHFRPGYQPPDEVKDLWEQIENSKPSWDKIAWTMQGKITRHSKNITRAIKASKSILQAVKEFGLENLPDFDYESWREELNEIIREWNKLQPHVGKVIGKTSFSQLVSGISTLPQRIALYSAIGVVMYFLIRWLLKGGFKVLTKALKPRKSLRLKWERK